MQVHFGMFIGIRFVLYCWSRTSCTYTSTRPVAQPACQPVVNYRAPVDKVCKAARWICAPAPGVPDWHSERLLDTHTATAICIIIWLSARCLGYATRWYTDRNLKGCSYRSVYSVILSSDIVCPTLLHVSLSFAVFCNLVRFCFCAFDHFLCWKLLILCPVVCFGFWLLWWSTLGYVIYKEFGL